MSSDAGLKGKVKALAKKSNLKPQELLQMYLFERLLVRLEKSCYADKFILKGGLLISSMAGVAQRTTMDMDATVTGMSMDEQSVIDAVSAICAVDAGDGMEYDFDRIEPIREGARLLPHSYTIPLEGRRAERRRAPRRPGGRRDRRECAGWSSR